MSRGTRKSNPRVTRSVPRRAWLLASVAALAGLACGLIALILDGALGVAFGGAAIVLLITAFVCVGVTSQEFSSGPPFDPDEPPPIPPVPQSEVALIYDPGETPNHGLERDVLLDLAKQKRLRRPMSWFGLGAAYSLLGASYPMTVVGMNGIVSLLIGGATAIAAALVVRRRWGEEIWFANSALH